MRNSICHWKLFQPQIDTPNCLMTKTLSCLCWKIKSINYMIQNTVMSSAVSGNDINSIGELMGVIGTLLAGETLNK